MTSPLDRSRAALPENIRKTLEESNLPVEVATAIADLCDGLIRPEEERSEIRYTPVACTEEQRRIAWDSGLALLGDAKLVWVNEGDFWPFRGSFDTHEYLAPSKPATSSDAARKEVPEEKP